MRYFIHCTSIIFLVMWTCFVHADSRTIIISENSLPYSGQTWFYNSNVGEIKKTIKENWDKGKRITSGAYTDKGWFLTMASNTTISMQTYSFSADWPSNWIKDNWDNDYYITSISYSGSQWLVVMSQDSRFSGQTYNRDSWTNLKSWIKNNWDSGYRITEAAHNGTYWTIVMSKTNFIDAQSYSFASNNIEKKVQEAWDDGYNIQLLNSGGGEFFLVSCKYLENNGRTQAYHTQVSNIKEYVQKIWDASEDISYIGGGDNYVSQYVEPQQYYPYPQYEPAGNYYNPYGGYPSAEPTQQHRACRGCNGTGICTMCKGKGWYKNQYSGNINNCPSCNGTGKCGVCHGKGHCN